MDSTDNNFYTHLSDLIVSIQDAATELEIYRQTAAILPRIIPAERASMVLLNADCNELEVIGLSGYESALPVGKRLPVSRAMVGEIIVGQQGRIWQPEPESEYVDSLALSTDGFRSAIGMPLIVRDEVLGCFNVGSTKAHCYQTTHLELFQRVVAVVAVHVDRRRLYEHALAASDRHKDNVRRFEVLTTIGQRLSAALSAEDVFNIVADCAEHVIQAERVSFAVLEDDGEHFRIDHVRGNDVIPKNTVIPLANTSVGKAVDTRTTIFIPQLDKQGTLGEVGMQQCWSAPVVVEDRVACVLNIASREVGFSDGDATALFEAIAQNMGLALERVYIQEKAATALNDLIDNSPLMLVVLNADGIIQRVSRFGSNALGYQAENLCNQPFVLLHPHAERENTERRIQLWRGQAQDYVHGEEVQMLVRDGRICWVRQTARVTKGDDGEIQILVSCENVDALHELNKQLRYQARTDLLTGTPNRLAFNEALEEAIKVSARSHRPLGVMFIDLDHFKDVNDSLGHDFGDRVLCIVAEKIARQLREDDLVSRTGGDEFLVMLPNAENIDVIEATARRIFTSIRQPITIADKKINILCSIGISRYPSNGNTPDLLIKNADIAMYHAKAKGRNNYQFFSSELSTQLVDRLNLESDLRNAVEGEQLRLVFQPLYNMQNNQIIACEALVRWQHPVRGLICPDEFIPLAESSGAINSITTWVMNNALAVLKRLHQKHPALRMSINVSATEFSPDGDLLQRVDQCLWGQEVNADALVLELTESTLLEHPDAAVGIIRQLNERGVLLAIDDFGTGFASFSNLMSLPLRTVKIDREFVAGMDMNPRKKAIIEGIITMARNMELSCIAEGVETHGELASLQQLGCDSVQGYLLSHPIAEHQLLLALDQSSPDGFQFRA